MRYKSSEPFMVCIWCETEEEGRKCVYVYAHMDGI